MKHCPHKMSEVHNRCCFCGEQRETQWGPLPGHGKYVTADLKVPRRPDWDDECPARSELVTVGHQNAVDE